MKNIQSTCLQLAAKTKFRFAGLVILLALSINAEAAAILNLDLSFDQATIPGSVGGSPGTATGTFTLTGSSLCNSTGDHYGGGYQFGTAWMNILSSTLPESTSLSFSLVPVTGAVTYDGGPYAATSIETSMQVDSAMGSYFDCLVLGATPVTAGKLIAFTLAGTFTANNYGSEMGADLVSGSFDNHGEGSTYVVTNLSAVPEPSEWAAMSLGVLGIVWVAKRRFMPARA